MRSLKPQTINSTCWYYENGRSFVFVVECRDVNGYHKTIQFQVPASKIERSLKRMERPPKRKGQEMRFGGKVDLEAIRRSVA